jgi:hypothetical protein
VNCPTSSPPNQSPNDSPKRRWNLPNLHLGGPDPNSLLSSDPKPKFPSSFQNKKKSIKIRFKMFHHYQINQKSEFCLFCVGSIETIAGGWKSSYSFHSLKNIFLFCFAFNFISAFRKATISRDAHSAIFTLRWLTRSPKENYRKKKTTIATTQKRGKEEPPKKRRHGREEEDKKRDKKNFLGGLKRTAVGAISRNCM